MNKICKSVIIDNVDVSKCDIYLSNNEMIQAKYSFYNFKQYFKNISNFYKN